MINIDQVRILEQKVKQAVQLISNLKGENNFLRGKLADYEVRIQELETLLHSLKDSQTAIEAGIASAIEQLEDVNDASIDVSSSQPSSPVEDPAAVDVVTAPIVPETVPEAISEETAEVEDHINTESATEEKASSESLFDDEPDVSLEEESSLSFEDNLENVGTSDTDSGKEEDQQQGLGIF